MQQVLHMDSPLGCLALAEQNGALTALAFSNEKLPPGEYEEQETSLLREAVRQLTEYFAGRLQEFDLPLAPQGTEFQQACWQALLEIPYGQTRSYGDIAQRINRPKAVRAVGQANHNNPIAIIIPCHRVIGGSGKLVGYGGGLDKKEVLLKLEGISLF